VADIAAPATTRANLTAPLFIAAIFTSATLVFLVQPMMAKLLLPKLGGSPAVWNASMAFFQAALLAGYGYAHGLQRVKSLKVQAIVHLAVLALAGLVLPLALPAFMGDPSSAAPVSWLLSVLLLSVGAPFAVLSATAPLLQSWSARLKGRHADNPYALYVASNVGSLLALLAYPIVVEPTLVLKDQTQLWAGGYGLFIALVACLALAIFRSGATAGPVAAAAAAPAQPAAAITWRDRAAWIGLSAMPASLMLGATTFISTDIAAAPFLWVLPLALYLVTFIVAFQEKPSIRPATGLFAQSLTAPLCLVLAYSVMPWWSALALHLAAFFAAALVCHQAMAARRPAPERLTEFYLCVSIGGVIGGAATAFLAPVVFNLVLEYPLVMVLAALARPAGDKATRKEWGMLAAAGCGALTLSVLGAMGKITGTSAIMLMSVSLAVAVLVRKNRLLFTLALAALAAQSVQVSQKEGHLHVARSFFGVHRVAEGQVAALGGEVHLLVHGTTLHGAQPQAPALRCQTTTYYAKATPLGQTYLGLQAARPALNIAAVGLGSGSVAAYVRPTDRLRFFEIDPEVERIARDPRYFTYISGCAKGPVDVVLGDARLTLAKEPAGSYDLLHIDAFSSDAIPTHLMTVEAMEQYLKMLKPDGVLLLHISNRHLDLEGPAAAAAKRLGATALYQHYQPAKDAPPVVATPTKAMLISRSPEALKQAAAGNAWRPAEAGTARAWTDDYTNVMGALVSHTLASLRGEP
jgi:spermidine synthase